MTKINGKYHRSVKKRKDGKCPPGTKKVRRKGQTRCWRPVKKRRR